MKTFVKRFNILLLSAVLLVSVLPSPSAMAAPVEQRSTTVTVISKLYVNVRSGPGLNFGVIAKIYPKETYPCTGKSGNWYRITLKDNREGYVSDLLVSDGQMPASATVTVTSRQYVNVRSGPGLNFGVIAKIYPRETYPTTGTSGFWYRITLKNGKEGYVSANLVQSSAAAPQNTVTVVSKQYVNVRSGPGFNFGVLGKIYPRETYPCTGTSGNWYRITLSNGKEGYVAGGLVRYSGSANQNPNLPSFGNRTYTIPVYYRTGDGSLISSDSVLVSTGSNRVHANGNKVPAAYTLQSPASVSVNVSANGNISLSAVIFVYNLTAPPSSATTARITIEYRNMQGGLIASSVMDLPRGSRVIKADSSILPAGYLPVGSKETVVSVSNDLKAYPSVVTFPCASIGMDSTVNPSSPPAATPAPTAGQSSIYVFYRSKDGVTLGTETVALNLGNNTVNANPSYAVKNTLTSPASVNVFVSPQGIPTPSVVVFTYATASVSQNVNVIYQDNAGKLISSESLTFGSGTQTVSANASLVPHGYVLQGAGSVQVVVDAYGARPSTVTFTYAPPAPVSVQVPILYKDANGTVLSRESLTLAAGTTTITLDNAKIPSGYTLQGDNSCRIVVSPEGVATPNEVIFTFKANPPAGSGSDSAIQGSTPLEYGSAFTLPSPVNGTPTGEFAVYTGPAEAAYKRIDNASINGGTCQFYGIQYGFAMIGYENGSGNQRIGFISQSGVPTDISLPALEFSTQTVTANTDTSMTDEPLGKGSSILNIPKGTSLTLLGFLPNNNHWAYVETDTEGKMIRGFVQRTTLSR